MIRVAVVDDHPLFRSGVIQTMQAADDVEVIGQGASAEDAIRISRDLCPDVLVLDMNFADRRDGIRAAEAITSGVPGVRILMLTVVTDSASIREAIKRGVRGYVEKGIGGAELLAAVRAVHRGEGYVTPTLAGSLFSSPEREHAQSSPSAPPSLSARENQILSFIARGLSNKEIGLRLEISDKTVKHYVTNLFQKMQVRNRTEAAIVASNVREGMRGAPTAADRVDDHLATMSGAQRRRAR